MHALLEFPAIKPLFVLPQPEPEPEWLNVKEVKGFDCRDSIIYVELSDGSFWVAVPEAICSPKPESFHRSVLTGIVATKINGVHVISAKFKNPGADLHVGFYKGDENDLSVFLKNVNAMLKLTPP